MLTFRPRKATRRIIIHGGHEDVPEADPVPILRVRGREMGLLEVGYHLVIDAKGGCEECRPHQLMGSHTPGHNHDSIGVYIAGQRLSPMQLHVLGFYAAFWEGYYGLPANTLPIVGKSEVIRYRNKPTGPFFNMDELRAKLGITH